ncbi:MAG TPA: rod shape-determining protein MreD [Anaerolineales bacterium]|nr:rod shape-determining protein MreD [Anaerolineales bacterium]HNO31876.1 rod shape-determining protein MreD [Anaerolineales bacterium]
MRNLIAFPLLVLAVILQTSIVSEVRLLSGYADLPFLIIAAWALQERVESSWHWGAITCLMVGFVSGMPWPVLVLGYIGVIFLARALQRRVWQAPLLAMFSVVFTGTLLMHLLSFIVLRLLGTDFSVSDVLGLVTLPSLLLNMLICIPVFAMMRDLSYWVYPLEEFE